MAAIENDPDSPGEKPGEKPVEKMDLIVLYVEDEDVPRERLSAILGRRVATVHTAGDGREGLDTYRRVRPDIVITDIRMPGMDGLQMVREIRSADPETKVIVTTAFGEVQPILEFIDLDVDGYILKPVDIGKLFAMIGRCAEVIRLRREVEKRDRDQRGLITELTSALAEIRTLQAILPICSSCKKIRDDKGYWTQVESYISEHTRTRFTHSICPDCVRRLYPDIADDWLNDPGKK